MFLVKIIDVFVGFMEFLFRPDDTDAPTLFGVRRRTLVVVAIGTILFAAALGAVGYGGYLLVTGTP